LISCSLRTYRQDLESEGIRYWLACQEEEMKRRAFVHSVTALALAPGLQRTDAGAQPGERYLTLDWFRSRRDQDLARLRAFLGDSMLPAYGRSGVKPMGIFQTQIGPDNPSFLVVASYPSMAAIQETHAKLLSDEKWPKELRAFDDKWELAYERRESTLLRGFKTFPGIEVPQVAEGKSNLFELRIYESRNVSAHEKKIAMFDTGEISIFRRVGINPVFFGATVFGARMPNLTYLVYYPSWEARAEAWSKFGQDAEWKKMSTAPGNSDRELVSSISNQLMAPLPFSQIR
jgi:NIPSNAP